MTSWLDRLAQRTLRPRSGGPDSETPPPAPRIAVVTDSAAALPPGWDLQAGVAELVRVVPMPVMVSDQIFGEGVDDMAEELAVALAQGSAVKTSRPSPGQFEGVYRELAERGFAGIVSIHISAELSGTVDAARLAAVRANIPVEVVDGRTVGMAQGFGVAAAALAARAGADLPGVTERALEVLRSSAVYFYVPSLEQLRRGGRIGAAASIVGTLLAVKPILSVQNGSIAPLERIRSAPKAIARLEELVSQDVAARAGSSAVAGDIRVAVHHFGNPRQAGELAEHLLARYPDLEVLISPVPAVLAAHTGLGVLAVAIVGGTVSPAPTPST